MSDEQKQPDSNVAAGAPPPAPAPKPLTAEELAAKKSDLEKQIAELKKELAAEPAYITDEKKRKAEVLTKLNAAEGELQGLK